MKTKLLIGTLLLFLLPSTLQALSLTDERKYGREMYVEIVRSARANTDPYLAIYMGIIKQRLEEAADLPFPIKLTIVRSHTLDAFATPGGYVYLTDGLIEQCDKEEEVAGVLGHEFSHVGRRHIAKRLEKEKFINWGTMATLALGMLVPGAQGAVMAAGMGAAQTLSLRYSREDEEEADRVGLANAEKAGYNPMGITDFMKKLRSKENEKMIPQYLLTHPYTEERIARAERLRPGAPTRVDVSLFPYIVAREKILASPITMQNEEIWFKRYQRDPKDPVNAYAASLVYRAKGNNKEAGALLEGIESPFRKLFLGEFYVSSNRFKEATELLSGETHPVARYYLARAYEGEGNQARAGEVLKELVAYADTCPEIYQRIGMLSGKQGNEAGGYAFLGRYYLETGREGAARNYLEKAVSKYGMNSPEGTELLSLLDTIKKPGRSGSGARFGFGVNPVGPMTPEPQ
jgi:beta-barrel assembly-enhancing protease